MDALVKREVSAVSRFRRLPRAERFHIWARRWSVPLRALVQAVCERTPPGGRVADLGCGHGLLLALLSEKCPGRDLVGVDPDARKIHFARSALGELPRVSFEVGTVNELSGTFDVVVVADVLYLLPPSQWPGMLEAIRALLRPGGTLLLKEARADGTWKHLKCLVQEWLMVKLFRRTLGSGGLTLLKEADVCLFLAEAGFSSVQSRDLSAGYSTPHVLYEAAR